MTPIIFESFARPQPWGARNLKTLLGKTLPDVGQTYGESWEISAQRLHISQVMQGDYAGATLEELWNDHRLQLAGGRFSDEPVFPWLIKYLDVDPMLSVQVHPNDQQAQQLFAEPRGKTEAQIVLAAGPDARIYAGFKEPVSREKFADLLSRDKLLDCLHVITPQVGDCFYIPAGTIHASGGGVVLAEVQQTSDVTFRLYDWGRRDKDGNARQLHLAQALEVLDWSQGPVMPQVPKIIESTDKYQLELLADSPYFKIERVSGDFHLNSSAYHGMQVTMLLRGTAELSYRQNGELVSLEHQAGQTVLFPGACENFEYQLKNAQALIVR